MYNGGNFIGQFVTILSVNKTREVMLIFLESVSDGRIAPVFCVVFMGADCAHFFRLEEISMNKRVRNLIYAAILAALYVVLTNLQNYLIPGSATWAIQLRLSEALGIFSFFTPAAAPGLAVGCLLFNLNYAAALPLDIVLGTLATYLACKGMWLTRKVTVKGIPLLGLAMPALTNAVLVGLELTVYIGGAFWLNALTVALGELIVLYVFGTALYLLMKNRRLDVRLFGE